MGFEDQHSDVAMTISDGGSTLPEAQLLPRGAAVSRYIVADLLGRGGMGVVYKAFDPELNRPVALKLLSFKRANDQSSQEFAVHKTRLLREAQALAQLSHPNVVTVFDVGTFGESVFMAMELVEGKDLKAVLDEKAKSRAELLEIMKAAGRGLAAAHKVGIVHRDFKPGNVIIGNDGRVRVLDFGLARGAGAEEQAPSMDASKLETPASDQHEPSSSNLLLSQLTQAGAIVGTPHYMAPEQHLSQPVDARSDQFAFCVVLFEALYGVRPFEARSLTEMVHHVTVGKIHRPAKHSVPAWLDRIATRGLAVDPAARYQSMEALLRDLEDDPGVARAKRRARQLRRLLIALVLLFAGLGAYGVWYGMTQGARRCRGSEDATRLAGVWDEGVRARVQGAFGQSGRPYAADTFGRVAKILDGYARGWAAARLDACEASYVRGEQSERLLDLRMQCLERRLMETRALTELLSGKPDGAMVDRAVEAALGLIPLAACADKKALLADVPPPEDPAVRPQVEAVRKRLDDAKALEKIGRYKDALALAQEIQATSERLAYKPLMSEVRYRIGVLLIRVGRYTEAEQALRDAAFLADAAGHDRLRAMALNDLIYLVGYLQAHLEQGEQLEAVAGGVIDRIQDEGEIRARWLQNSGVINYVKREYDQALERYLLAQQILERALGPDHPTVATSHNNIGVMLYEKGEYRQALLHYETALQIRERTLGLTHPDVAFSHNNIGIVYYDTGAYDQALVHLERGLKLFEEALGPAQPEVATCHYNLGLVFFEQGVLDRALEHSEQALNILQRTVGVDHPASADPLSTLGWIALRRGELARARARFEQVLALCGPDRCAGDEMESLSRARFGLAKVLGSSGGARDQAVSLARQALDYLRTLSSVPARKLRDAAEAWLREREAKPRAAPAR